MILIADGRLLEIRERLDLVRDDGRPYRAPLWSCDDEAEASAILLASGGARLLPPETERAISKADVVLATRVAASGVITISCLPETHWASCCDRCGAFRIKLWRGPLSWGPCPTPRCARCWGELRGLETTDLHRESDDESHLDVVADDALCLGPLFPALPRCGAARGLPPFRRAASAPQPLVAWWRRLPLTGGVA